LFVLQPGRFSRSGFAAGSFKFKGFFELVQAKLLIAAYELIPMSTGRGHRKKIRGLLPNKA